MNRYLLSALGYAEDIDAASLALALRPRLPDWSAIGIGARATAQAGVRVDTTADQARSALATLASQSLFEKSLIGRVEREDVKFAVLVGAHEFHLELAEKLSRRLIPVCLYGAPTPKQCRNSSLLSSMKSLKLILSTLPFEKELLGGLGLTTVFVGVPMKDRTDKVWVDGAALGVDDRNLIVMLPGYQEGSRRELTPVMLELFSKMKAERPGLDGLLMWPCANGLAELEVVLGAGFDTTKVRLSDHLMNGFYYDDVHVVSHANLESISVAALAMVSGGQESLMCGLLGTPMLSLTAESSGYADSSLLFSSVINLVSGRFVVPEWLPGFSMDEALVHAKALVDRGLTFDQQKSDFEQMDRSLLPGAASRAAQVICEQLHSAWT